MFCIRCISSKKMLLKIWNLKYKCRNSKGRTFGNLIDNILLILSQYSTSQQSSLNQFVQVVRTPWKSTSCNKNGQATITYENLHIHLSIQKKNKKCQNNKIHCNFHSFHSPCSIYPSNSLRGHISYKTYYLSIQHKKMSKQQNTF